MTRWAAAGVAILAVAIRIPGAVRDAFWQDEVSSAKVLVAHSPVSAIRQVARVEATPPLWYALGWLANAVGVRPEWYRGLSVLAGGLLAGAVVYLARRVLPLWASVAAGLLVAFGWQFVDHGRELRAYEFLALLSVLFALALASRHEWGLAVCVVAGALTNYFFLLSVLAGVIWLWTEPTVREARRRLTGVIAVSLVPLLVWSPVIVHQYRGHRFTWIGPFNMRRVLEAFWLLFVHKLPTASYARESIPILLLGLVLAGAVVLWIGAPAGRLIALMALVPFVLESLAWLAGVRIFDTRNLIGAAPFAAVALAALAARIPRPVSYAVAVAGVVLVTAGSIAAESTPSIPYDRAAHTLVSDGWRPGDPIVVFGDFFAFRSPLEWYLPGRPKLTLAEPSANGTCAAIFLVAAGPANQRLAYQRLAGGRKVGPLLVGRLRAHRPPAWPRARLLAATRRRPGCAVLVPENRIVSRLRG
ncbi:MAG TPA: hypothetical protein VMG74_11780 [Gaiellaceae bacterium]|nr:hypothetical protein [Gaiellaceae bacterium]